MGFLVACYSPILVHQLVGWSVLFLLFRHFWAFWAHSSCPNALVTFSSTAPAHPHETGVAVYLALFSLYSMIVFVCNISWRHNLKSCRDSLFLKKDTERYWKYILWYQTPKTFHQKFGPDFLLQPETLEKLNSELLLFSRFFLNFPRPYILIEWANFFFWENVRATAMWWRKIGE